MDQTAQWDHKDDDYHSVTETICKYLSHFFLTLRNFNDHKIMHMDYFQ
jgi:hypothetical protein